MDFKYLGRDTVIELKVPNGYKGGLYIKELAYDKYKYQEEFLFNVGLKYRITSAKIKDNKYYLEVEVINNV